MDLFILSFLSFKKKYVFIYCLAVRGLICDLRDLHHDMWTLSCGRHVGFSSLTRDQTQALFNWEHGVLLTETPEKSLQFGSCIFVSDVGPYVNLV